MPHFISKRFLIFFSLIMCFVLSNTNCGGEESVAAPEPVDPSEPEKEIECTLSKQTVYDAGDRVRSYTVHTPGTSHTERFIRKVYNPDGQLQNKIVVHYTDFDAKLKETFYSDQDTMQGYILYTYNQNELLSKESYYDPMDKLGGYYTYEYEDGKKNRIVKRYFNGVDELQEETVIETRYDDQDRKIKTVFLNMDGQVVSYVLYEYDANGNLIKKSQFINEFLENYTVYEYECE
jgi:hypothetical protein